VGDTIEQQTEQTIDNISAILEADGASLSDVGKVTVHLSDTSHFARYNSVYAQHFSQPYGAHHGWQRSRPCSRNADRDRWHPHRPKKTSKKKPRMAKKKVARQSR
jgi:hypothetical protein